MKRVSDIERISHWRVFSLLMKRILLLKYTYIFPIKFFLLKLKNKSDCKFVEILDYS